MFTLIKEAGGLTLASKLQKLVKINRPNLFEPELQPKRSLIKQFGRLMSIYLVQSVHAPHSGQVNAARAS
jgi:hypothetical protein